MHATKTMEDGLKYLGYTLLQIFGVNAKIATKFSNSSICWKNITYNKKLLNFIEILKLVEQKDDHFI